MLNYQNIENDKMNTTEAYEVLLYDCMCGDSTNFTHWDEVALSWKYVDIIAKAWERKADNFPNYLSGSTGPKDSERLLSRDGFHWWNVTEKGYTER